MELILGKEEFYKLVEEAFIAKGYIYYNNESIKGKGKGHASKPDYIAFKDKIAIIGEIKAPKEPPETGSWRQIQKGDSEEFAKIRLEIAQREQSGQLSKSIGGHEIILRGQIPDYFSKVGITYVPPPELKKAKKILAGYSFPTSELLNVTKALTNTQKNIFEKIDIGNGATSFIFKL